MIQNINGRDYRLYLVESIHASEIDVAVLSEVIEYINGLRADA